MYILLAYFIKILMLLKIMLWGVALLNLLFCNKNATLHTCVRQQDRHSPILTNSMTYGTRRLNDTFTGIKRSEKATNEQVLEHIGEKRTLLNNILHRKANWICHILRNYLLNDVIEGQLMEVEGVGRRRIAPRWFEKQKKILGAKGGSWRSK